MGASAIIIHVSKLISHMSVHRVHVCAHMLCKASSFTVQRRPLEAAGHRAGDAHHEEAHGPKVVPRTCLEGVGEQHSRRAQRGAPASFSICLHER